MWTEEEKESFLDTLTEQQRKGLSAPLFDFESI